MGDQWGEDVNNSPLPGTHNSRYSELNDIENLCVLYSLKPCLWECYDNTGGPWFFHVYFEHNIFFKKCA